MSQPHSEPLPITPCFGGQYPVGVNDQIDSRRVLWANLRALMEHRWGGENLTRLSREADIGPGSCSRIKAQQTSVGLEIVDKIASLFSLQTWQLFVPNLDPRSPPVLAPMSDAERDFYTRMLSAARAFKDTHK